MPIEFHRNMLADQTRNQAFYRALQKVIQKNKTTVADIGSGTGVLGFMASQLGAKEVYLYEQADVLFLSEHLAKTNKVKNCHFFHTHSTAFIDPPPADVIVSETFGNYGFEEQMIETMEDAKRFLNPGGVLIPQQVDHFAAPVVSDRFFKELCVWDNVGYGLDFSAAKEMSLNNAYVRTFKAGDLLNQGKAAQVWDSVNFYKKNKSNRKGTATWTLKTPATFYGFAVWWTSILVPGVTLSTSPFTSKTHWEQLYFPVLEPIKAKKGDRITFTITTESSYEAGTTFRWQVSWKSASGKMKKQSLDLRKGFLE